LIEIRWHGRGGQGAWTASNILAQAALKEEKYAQSFPAFGPERMGTPILAFTRISDEPIHIHCMVYNPDAIVVLDPTLLKTINVVAGLKEGGTIIVNYSNEARELYKLFNVEAGKYRVYIVPATEIAIEVLGRPIANTAMIGSLVKAMGVVRLESVLETIRERFPGTIGERNVEAAKRAYEQVEEV